MSEDSKPHDGPVATVDALPKGSRLVGLLTSIAGPVPGTQVEIIDSVVLGSSAEHATFVVSGADISAEHARVWRTAAGAFMAEDMGSQSGTYINDVKVQRRALMLRDRIRLGADVVFEFTF